MQIPAEAREPPDHLELELQEVVNHPVWILRPSRRAVHAMYHRALSLALRFVFADTDTQYLGFK